eukprot:1546309-Prymnesium_polylepis.1
MALYLREHNRSEAEYKAAVQTFCASLAASCVATYVMGIGDRHNDNVLLTRAGCLVHIDFGHFLGNFKSKFGLKREAGTFVFTPDFAHVLGGKGSDTYDRFVQLSGRAYNALRRRSDQLSAPPPRAPSPLATLPLLLRAGCLFSLCPFPHGRP